LTLRSQSGGGAGLAASSVLSAGDDHDFRLRLFENHMTRRLCGAGASMSHHQQAKTEDRMSIHKVAFRVFALCAATISLSPSATAAQPPILREQGSFFINGEVVRTENPGGQAPGGRVVVNQMYVEYSVPKRQNPAALPIIMVHGSGHTGKTYDTTPDGRDGWKQYFLRKGYTVYVVDHAGRARSGWNPEAINQAQTKGDAGLIPKSGIVQFTYERAWGVFRFGPKPDEWWPDSKFPKEHLDQYMAQLVPNSEVTLRQSPQPTVSALIALLDKIGPAMLMVHSQSGTYGTQTALARPDLLKGYINVEGRTGCNLTPDQVKIMARVPWLNVAGDHNWNGDAECRAATSLVSDAGGEAAFLATYEKGVRGNTHMMMMDINNLQVADWILDWIKQNVGAARSKSARK
jgi:pimeloyl-ACP methyl ester carboxylesterase